MPNLYYKLYLMEVLTDNGIVVTDGPNQHYVKTVPNDHKVTILLRKAISLWESGDIDAFLEIYADKEKSRRDWSIEDRFRLKCTRFGNPRTCLSWIEEEIAIAEYKAIIAAENQ